MSDARKIPFENRVSASPPGDEPLVRLAEARDLEALLELVEQVQALHVQHRPELFAPMVPEAVRGRLEQLLADPAATVWVAEAAGAVRGYLVAIVRSQAATAVTFARSSLELDQICVDSHFRRSGIARALIVTALAHARTLGIAAVELTSWSFNHEAQRAFEQLGFVPKVVRFEHASGIPSPAGEREEP